MSEFEVAARVAREGARADRLRERDRCDRDDAQGAAPTGVATLTLPFGLVATGADVRRVREGRGLRVGRVRRRRRRRSRSASSHARCAPSARCSRSTIRPRAASCSRSAARSASSARTSGPRRVLAPRSLRARMVTGVVALLGCTWGAVHYWRGYVRGQRATAALASPAAPRRSSNELATRCRRRRRTRPTAGDDKVDRSRQPVPGRGDARRERRGGDPDGRLQDAARELARDARDRDGAAASPLGFVTESNDVRYLSSTNPAWSSRSTRARARRRSRCTSSSRTPGQGITFWVVPTLTVASCR